MNSRARIVLTVSPVAPVATIEPRHVVVSAVASKSILRAAADEIERAHDNVQYFPSYEVITAPFGRGAYLAPDQRTVTAAGVAHVMRLFFAHCAEADAPLDATLQAEIEQQMDVVCDEERIGAAGG